jgi:hypothetical protein
VSGPAPRPGEGYFQNDAIGLDPRRYAIGL